MNNKKEEELYSSQRRISITTLLRSEEDYPNRYIQEWLDGNKDKKKQEVTKEVVPEDNVPHSNENITENDQHAVDETATTKFSCSQHKQKRNSKYKHKNEKDRTSASPYAWDRNWILADGTFQNLMEGFKQKERKTKRNDNDQQQPAQNSN